MSSVVMNVGHRYLRCVISLETSSLFASNSFKSIGVVTASTSRVVMSGCFI